LLDLLMRQDTGNYRVADVGSGAARRGSTPRAPHGVDSVAASGSWAATGQPARPGSVWAATPSAAREQSAPPPTERTSA